MFEMIPFRRNNNLTRRDDFFSPFLKSFFDDDFFSAINTIQGNFKVDLKETDENYLVEADLPGVKKEAIDIDFDNNYLTITAKRDDTIEDKKENYVRRERHYGEFKRSFYINNVDENKIDASFNDGVLKITLPKLNKGNDKKRKIDIH
ncbi:Hsp20/alpha crystallin family protein [Clostridium sp. SYSU_GA19001]|uniref:heat shock protein Hsp18 n=1 Tax=Clostridium caldaquaticum TaxID=2940653 RepID=UPI002077401A|nr:heat shock protein Hsp18 [Clostridium caldaquaticum]MCM8709613.1 Hsp20/alpha crystallin family protein [Clostridium caldaquaticum]